MKNLDYYMNLPYKMEVVPDIDEGGFAVSFPELSGCVTCADTLENALKNAADAKKEWLTAALEDGIEIAEPSDVNSFSGQFKLRIPKSLHKQLSEHAKIEGISMNQYCLYLLTMNDCKEFVK